jgi:hypothetical protein
MTLHMSTGVTGRDAYITAEALIYAIAHIQSLPPEKQERGDMLDMCAIAKTRHRDLLPLLIDRVFLHTGIMCHSRSSRPRRRMTRETSKEGEPLFTPQETAAKPNIAVKALMAHVLTGRSRKRRSKQRRRRALDRSPWTICGGGIGTKSASTIAARHDPKYIARLVGRLAACRTELCHSRLSNPSYTV